MNKRVTSVLIAALFILALISCGKKAQDRTVFTYGDSTIRESEYRYWLSTYKYVFSTAVEGFEDSDEYYGRQVAGGVTAGEVLAAEVARNVKSTLIAAEEFDLRGLKLSDDSVSTVDGYMETLEREAGGKKNLDGELAKFGVNSDQLHEIYVRDAKSRELEDRMLETGELTVTDDDREAFFAGNYVHFLHIYVADKYEFEKDENGEYVRDDEDNPVQIEMTEEQIAGKEQKIKDIRAALDRGDDFSEVYEKYSEDRKYDGGYYLRSDSPFFPEVISAAFALEPGKYTEADTAAGVHFIYRLEPEDHAYLKEENTDFFTDFETAAEDYVFGNYIKDRFAEVMTNEDVISSISFRDAVPNSKY